VIKKAPLAKIVQTKICSTSRPFENCPFSHYKLYGRKRRTESQ